MAETKEERRARIEKSVAERSAARRTAQEEARQKTMEQAKTATGLKEGYEFYAGSTAGGGFELRQRPTEETLKAAYTTLLTPPDQRVYTPKVGSNIYQMLNGTLYFSGTPFTGTTAEGVKYTGGQAFSGIDPENKNNRYSKGMLAATKDPVTGQWSLTAEGRRLKLNLDPATGAILETPGAEDETNMGMGTSGFFAQQAAQAAAEEKRRQGQSAYDLLLGQFNQYGLGALVEPLKGFITEGLSPAEFTIRLRDTDAYRKRFAANQARIQKGLRALSEAEYIGLEDQYQDVMRRYGLPETYYTRGDMGRQEGFEKFIGGDVSPVELEDRIQTAQRRVINAAPEVTASLRSFYPEIGQGDLLAYFLDPDKAIENIKRKVTAAEIGGAATMSGLTAGATRAEELARYGVTGEAARQGFQTIADILPRGSQLAEIYKQSPYTQTTAEQEVFGLTGATEASKRRRQLTQLEQAAFSGQAGTAGGALGRERAGAF